MEILDQSHKAFRQELPINGQVLSQAWEYLRVRLGPAQETDLRRLTIEEFVELWLDC
jgi:hypothetical protein